jgi:glycosyltransferase involved in cell wall biosynthesis
MNCKSILFISKGEHAASTRYRALAYFSFLRINGWHPVHITARHNLLPRIKLLRSASRADVVVILRKTFKIPFLRLLRLCSKRLVFDLDDSIFCNSDGSLSPARQNRFMQVVRNCQQIWAGNAYLAETARRHNAAVITLPTSLAPEEYSTKIEKPADHVDLIWIGSSSTRRYLEAALPTLQRLAHSFPALRLKVVADFGLPSQRLQTVVVPWSEEGESEALASAHIGIAPMPDNPWTRGKCGLKVLQYMAAGLPVISSPSGANGKIVKHGITGFLVESHEEWQVAIEKLICDPDLRRVMGEAGRKRVIEHYSVGVTYPKMVQALDTLLKK